MDKILHIELLTAGGCSRCRQLHAHLIQVIAAVDDARIELREVDVIDDIDYAVRLGVSRTPAIAISGELVFNGPPTKDRLRRVIEERLACC